MKVHIIPGRTHDQVEAKANALLAGLDDVVLVGVAYAAVPSGRELVLVVREANDQVDDGAAGRWIDGQLGKAL